MPIYEYDCEKCGHRFEQLVRADEEVVCPECGSAQVAKRFSTFASKSSSAPPAPT
jgi:putative FmdB family regulatory protein